VLVPLAVIALFSALAYALAAGAARQRANADTQPRGRRPATRRSQTRPPSAPRPPEPRADARRSQQ